MKIYQPREELRPYVRYYWVLESHEHFSILTFPIGCPQIIFHKKLWGIERSGFFNGQGKWAKGFENQMV